MSRPPETPAQRTDRNFTDLSERSDFLNQKRVVQQPEATWVTAAIDAFSQNPDAPLSIDWGSKLAFDSGDTGNIFTSLVEIATKTIYMCPLSPDRTGTSHPRTEVMVGGRELAPITHTQGKSPGHQQLAAHLGKANQGAFIGFTVKKMADGSGVVTSVTSSSQNRQVFKREPTRNNFADVLQAKVSKTGSVDADVASENWTRLIVKSIVVLLPLACTERLSIE